MIFNTFLTCSCKSFVFHCKTNDFQFSASFLVINLKFHIVKLLILIIISFNFHGIFFYIIKSIISVAPWAQGHHGALLGPWAQGHHGALLGPWAPSLCL